LGTGCGKTLIAVLLLRHRLEQAAAEAAKQLPGAAVPSSPFPGRRLAVFLAPRVILVQQQAQVLARHLPARVKSYVGEMGVDSWDKPTWDRELYAVDVVVMTPQILLDLLSFGWIRMTEIHTLVFDEVRILSFLFLTMLDFLLLVPF
jgi:endoribonuclease Dicer